MKEVSATLRNLQISPRKVRLIADLIRGMAVEDARIQLAFSQKQAARPVLKLLNSAVANADHNFNLDVSTLRVKAIMVNEGPMLKRFTPRAFGRATMIRKRMSHIHIYLEGETGKAPATKAKKSDSEKKARKQVKGKSVEEKEAKKSPSKKPSTRSKKPQNVDPRGLGKQKPTRQLEQHNKKIISS